MFSNARSVTFKTTQATSVKKGSPRAYCITLSESCFLRDALMERGVWRMKITSRLEQGALLFAQLCVGFCFLSFITAWSDHSWPKDMLSSMFKIWNSPRFQEHMAGKRGHLWYWVESKFLLFFRPNSPSRSNRFWLAGGPSQWKKDS